MPGREPRREDATVGRRASCEPFCLLAFSLQSGAHPRGPPPASEPPMPTLTNPTRRALLGSGLGLFALALTGRGTAATKAAPGQVVLARFSNAAAPLGNETVAKVVLDDAQWRAKLSPL